ncbi:MAG: glycosyltransferase [Candidatus Binatia bacterium]
MTDATRPILVVPCYNEAARLDAGEFRRLGETADVWLVDDGSMDATHRVIEDVAGACAGRVRALANEKNLGKAETVRRHMLAACDSGTTVTGFLDADLATPVDEMLGLLAVLQSTGAEAVTAARVGLSGREVTRKASRHYSGRVFSTVASLAMQATYYDTQCGAKVFRNTAALRAALADPFLSRWAFDVELLGRLLAGAHGIDKVPAHRLVEHPLQVWRDVEGSKLTTGDAWRSGLELFLIWRDLARRRRR